MYLCFWLDTKLNRVKIDDIGIDGKLKELRQTATHLLNKQGERLEFTYRGSLMKDEDKTLADYDIGEDAEIHMFQVPKIIDTPLVYTDEDIRKVSWEIQVVSRVHNFHTIAHRTMRNRAITLIREAVPEVDNTTIAYTLNPELLLSLRDQETLKKIVKDHPTIMPAAKVVSELLQTQQVQFQSDNQNSSYFYGAHSSGDEEDMDSNTESSRDSHSPSRNSSVNPITPAQLAAAIANATNSAAGNSATTPSGGSNVITNEMLNSALRRALNLPNLTANSPISAENLNFSSLAGRYANQLRQMHELGLTNDAVNIRALHTTTGNLQEAVELVLNGVID